VRGFESEWRKQRPMVDARLCRLEGRHEAQRVEVSFPDYPWIKPVAPFRGWDDGRPTQTLPWYDAYNAAKHDRENELKGATLRSVFGAVAACAIMIVAQFGEVFGFDLNRSGRPRTFFWIRGGPVWDLADHYAEAFESGNGKWTPSTILCRGRTVVER
jgi:hypothetical protein